MRFSDGFVFCFSDLQMTCHEWWLRCWRHVKCLLFCFEHFLLGLLLTSLRAAQWLWIGCLSQQRNDCGVLTICCCCSMEWDKSSFRLVDKLVSSVSQPVSLITYLLISHLSRRAICLIWEVDRGGTFKLRYGRFFCHLLHLVHDKRLGLVNIGCRSCSRPTFRLSLTAWPTVFLNGQLNDTSVTSNVFAETVAGLFSASCLCAPPNTCTKSCLCQKVNRFNVLEVGELKIVWRVESEIMVMW